MAGTPITAAQSRDYNIKQCLVTSNDASKKKDISAIITDLYYYESVLNPTLKADLLYAETGKTVDDGGTLKTLVEGMPLVGTEKVKLEISDPNDVTLSLDLYIDNVQPIVDNTNRSGGTLNLVSGEEIYNYKTVLNNRFDGKISDHIKKIVSDPKYLGSKKKLDLEETTNNYNFIGNNRRPLYAILWLSRKGVPQVQGAQGNSAGYFFFETSDGFKFKSIESLLSDTEPGGGKKKYKSFVYNNTPDSRGSSIPPEYSGKIIEYDINTASGSAQSKMEIGTYSTRTILFNPFNCYYEVINPNAAGDSLASEKKLQKAGKNLPKYNEEFTRQGNNKDFSRTQYMLVDCGSLPSGDSKQQIQKSKEQNFDPKNILNQSVMRYNQFFSTSVDITINGDFSLHAGDYIYINAPELSNKDTQEMDKQFGGFYVISQLCHYISLSKGGWTKLTLVRDSVGSKGSPIPL